MNTAMVFLVLMLSGQERPTMVAMMAYETATECNAVLARAPKDQPNKWVCIRMEYNPPSEKPTVKI